MNTEIRLLIESHETLSGAAGALALRQEIAGYLDAHAPGWRAATVAELARAEVQKIEAENEPG